jgi:hypothetical protein
MISHTVGLLLVVLIIGAPIGFALTARPLGNFPYHWAIFQGILLPALSLQFGLGTLALAEKHRFLATLMFFCVFACSGTAAFGLFRRARIGVVFLIVSEFFLLILPSAIDSIYPPTGLPKQPLSAYGTGNVLLYAMIANVFYFRKRWALMGPGFRESHPTDI